MLNCSPDTYHFFSTNDVTYLIGKFKISAFQKNYDSSRKTVSTAEQRAENCRKLRIFVTRLFYFPDCYL